MLSIIAFFAILITGNNLKPILDVLVRVMRYGLKVNNYMLLLTDEWPGFSLS